MALLKAEAEKLSNNDLVAGVIEEIITQDDLFAVLPFTKTDGKAYVYNRENTITEGSFIDPVADTVPEGAATFTEITTNLRVLIGDVDVDKFLQATMGDTNDQMAIQIAARAKGMARAFRKNLVLGDNTGNPKEFDGISKLNVVGQEIEAGANGAALTLDMLDELIDAVPNGADIILMRPGTIRAYRTLLRAAGGLDPVQVQLENFGKPVLTHNGVPILVNEFLPATETQGTAIGVCASVYAMRLNEADGLHGLFGGSSAGIVVENIGTVQNKDASRIRLKWYCGLALKSTKSMARLVGVTNV